MSDRRICLDHDAVLLAELDQLQRRIADVEQDLVHHRLDGAGFHQAVQVADLEVGNADGTQLAFFIGIFQRTPCGTVALHITVIALVDLDPRLRTVDDHHVQIIQTHLFQGLVDALLGFLVGLMLCGDLGNDKQLFARNAAGADALADAALVAVSLCRIKMAVAQLCGLTDSLGSICVVDEPGAKAQLRNLDAIAQS